MGQQRVDWKYIDTEGNPIPPNHRIMPDHYVMEFKVVVRSTQAVSVDRLKSLIETKFEVTDCERTDAVCVGKDIQIVWNNPRIEAAAKEVIGRLPEKS